MVKIINNSVCGGSAGKRTQKVKGVVIHNDYGAMSPAEYINWLGRRKANGKLGLGFAHYYIDKDTIARVENTYNKAWHTGNNDGNANYIGYEVVESFYGVISDAEFIENENMTLRQAAEDLLFYGLAANRDTVRLHNEFKATSCPHRSWDLHVGKGAAYNAANKNKLKDYFIAKIKQYMAKGKTVQEMLKNEGIPSKIVVSVSKATGDHKVVKGDTLWDIANKYNTSISNIKALNNLTSDLINVGQVLKVNGKVPAKAVSKPKATIKEVKNKENLKADGYLGKDTVKALQRRFKTPVDGVISNQVKSSVTNSIISNAVTYGKGGSLVIKELQKYLGVTADGYLGQNTVKALQRKLGTPADGVISKPSTAIKELQNRLNKGNL